MSITLTELKEYMKSQVSEIDILELLDISSEELVEYFSDSIEDRMDELIHTLGLEEDISDELL
jgi:ribosome assembly protein YihI (activator of Der GTPase)